MNSMTGFGSAALRRRHVHLLVEIRSVNHRFLTVKVSLPDALNHLEHAVEDRLRREIERGSLTVAVRMERRAGSGPPLPDGRLLRRAYLHLRRVQKEQGIPGEVDLETILEAPHLWALPEAAPDLRALEAPLLGLVGRAAADLRRMRAREGRGIRRDIAARLGRIARIADRISLSAPAVRGQMERRLEERVAAVLEKKGIELARADIAREIALLADRIDVSEELQRLRSHVGQFRGFLDRPGPVGRRMEFLVQEMGREINTLGSKASDAGLSGLVVEVKAEIEKIKEQTDNVE